jgi:CubicO group peptidase (beta-lactamase class C family)
MRVRFNCLTSIILSILPALLACASAGSVRMSDVDQLMQRYDGHVPGASLLVIDHGKPIVSRSWGLADVEAGIKATPETNYRLASITKQFTAAAILLLMQDGKITLDDRIRRFFPALPAGLDSVTIQHLLTHTSGIVDYEDVIPDGTTAQLHDADVLKLLESHDTAYFRPGTSYQYSNSGYALLALIIEKASGKSFATFLHDRIFAPLAMKHTLAFENGISSVSNRAFGYTLKDGKWSRKDQSTTSAVLGDGGIYSSIDDLAKWDAALYDSRLLSDESRRLAFAPHANTDKPEVKYGFGWRITGETLWHSGETSGFRNVIIRNPSRRRTVIILTNRDDPEPYDTARTIMAR